MAAQADGAVVAGGGVGGGGGRGNGRGLHYRCGRHLTLVILGVRSSSARDVTRMLERQK